MKFSSKTRATDLEVGINDVHDVFYTTLASHVEYEVASAGTLISSDVVEVDISRLVLSGLVASEKYLLTHVSSFG